MYVKSSFQRLIQSIYEKQFNSSQDLSAIVDSMLSKDPEKRPSINQQLSLPNIIVQMDSTSKLIIDVEFTEGKNRDARVENTN
ncbi:Protein_kinase-like domain superfamily [Hexamita inflata]|uniref:Protein kinase-like domain superfamily n=1 Tax=Hexamita inflata TaxID=28002 RepID=A0AA86UMN7_9EUKA|nr:Protein kinase-like domain superfamily [Hexamita inflata]